MTSKQLSHPVRVGNCRNCFIAYSTRPVSVPKIALTRLSLYSPSFLLFRSSPSLGRIELPASVFSQWLLQLMIPIRSIVFLFGFRFRLSGQLLLLFGCYPPNLQGDHSTCAKPPVDIKTKVPLWPGLPWPGQAKAELLS